MKKTPNKDLSRKTVLEFKNEKKNPIYVILDNIRSRNNVGSIFRTCDAFHIQQLCLCGISPQPPHRDIEKTALGATQSVDWMYYSSTQSCIQKLKTENVEIFVIEQTSESVPLQKLQFEFHRPVALIFGNELKGVQDEVLELVDGAVEIPQYGTKHSLNISVSVGIVLWEVLRKLF